MARLVRGNSPQTTDTILLEFSVEAERLPAN
jgi:hypothetical protein